MSGSDKRIIKTVKLSNDEFSEITPESDLGNIVEQCTAIMDDHGYSDHIEAINKGRSNSEAYYYAGLGVLHARSALACLSEEKINDAVFNAMRAVHFQNLAIIRHTPLERDIWAGRKARTGALKTSEGSLKNQLETRSSFVEECRLREKAESMIPRYVAAMEGGYANAGLVPKKNVDNMRKYLRDHGLISKK